MNQEELYKVRCDKHTLRPYEYCEMCMIRSLLQNSIEDNRKMTRDMVANTHLAINVLNDCFNKLEKEIKELKQSILETRIQFINQLGNDKKPHKCPVCDGLAINCNIGEFRGLPIKTEKCNSCEGKGYIWG